MRWTVGTTMIVAGLAACVAPVAGSHAGHGSGSGHAHQDAEYCSRAFDEVVADGRGFGMAFVADRHGYPGPLHVLELKERLRLSADQEHAVRALLDSMFAEARPKGARLLETEARLGILFGAGTATEDEILAAVVEVERARRDVRMVHLLAHLRMRDLLSAEQRGLYYAARWGAHGSR